MLVEAIRAAARALRVPGEIDWTVIGPGEVEAIARERATSRREVEIAALEAGVVPLHYLRNLARFGIPGQIDLLRATVTVVGGGLPIRKCLQVLAAYGVGRLHVRVPREAVVRGRPAPGQAPRGLADRNDPPFLPPVSFTLRLLAAEATKVNASIETSADTLYLRSGDPASQLGEPDVVVACLEEMADEMLLQTVCRRRRVALVLGGLQGDQGQVTTILPDDPGVALLYRDDHPHLERSRPGSLIMEPERTRGRLVRTGANLGTWLAEQVVALRLGEGELLQNRLLYADMGTGEFQTFPLGR
jgi:molybdopterin/thiamine biosynthesis adenylyltransferase